MAENLVDVDTNLTADVFLFDRDTSTTRRVSVRTELRHETTGGDLPALSGDGRWITYSSYAADLVAGDTNGRTDVLLTRVW